MIATCQSWASPALISTNPQDWKMLVTRTWALAHRISLGLIWFFAQVSYLVLFRNRSTGIYFEMVVKITCNPNFVPCLEKVASFGSSCIVFLHALNIFWRYFILLCLFIIFFPTLPHCMFHESNNLVCCILLCILSTQKIPLYWISPSKGWVDERWLVSPVLMITKNVTYFQISPAG